MAILDIYLSSENQDYVDLANDILKFITLLIVFDYLYKNVFQKHKPDLNKTGDLLVVLCMIILGLGTYYLIVKKIIAIYAVEYLIDNSNE